MWLPTFKVIKGLFARLGEFTLAGGADYEGPYHQTADDHFFTGSEPNKDQIELIASLSILSSMDPYIDVHNDLKIPSEEIVYPKPKDYKRGFFIRYFLNDKRTSKLTEVYEQSYLRYKKELYIESTEVKWILEKPAKDIFMSGFLYKGAATRNKENVQIASANIKTITSHITDYEQFVNVESDIKGYSFMELPEKEKIRLIQAQRPNIQETPLRSINPRFKNKKLKKLKVKSNLYTPGGRFKIKGSNQEYVGYYHIHPEKGAMEGAVHKTEFHRKLIPIVGTVEVNAQQTITQTTSAAPTGGSSSGGSQSSAGISSGGSGGGYSGGGGSGGGGGY